jgi:TRAP-type C4-dicarboxylate transport system substrate-binding protein
MKFPTGMYLGSFGVFINPDFLDSLSEKDRKAIMSVSGEKLSAMAGRFWGEDVKVGEADARASGNTIMEAPASVLSEFDELTAGMDEEWLKAVEDRGIDANKALQELRATARSY